MKTLKSIFAILFVFVFVFAFVLEDSFTNNSSAVLFAQGKGLNSFGGSSLTNINVDFKSSNLPIVIIDTNEKTIPNEPKIVAQMKIISNENNERNFLSSTKYGYDGRIGIEQRGHSSRKYPKKQYAFETQNEQGENYNVSILGLPKENDWILHAPYGDKTLLRNVLTYKIFNSMERYASRTVFCELVLNGEYMGVYVLMEKIKRDKNRVKISKLKRSVISGDDLTGGYIIKIDKRTQNDVFWVSSFPSNISNNNRVHFQYCYPKSKDINDQQKKYIQNFIYEFEKVMNSSEYTNPSSGYLKYIDIASFVDFFIANEIGKNIDAYRLSTYMYKDKDSKGGKLKMGPIWDFNLAYGNASYHNGRLTSDWVIDYPNSDQYKVPFWWEKLILDDKFKGQLYERWNELRKDVLNINTIFKYIDSEVVYLDESQKRNFKRWPILGKWVWPNAYIGESYIDEINYLKKWLKERLLWIDAYMLSLNSDISENGTGKPKLFLLEQNYPNPFNPTTTISFSLKSTQNVKLEVFNVLGERVATLVNKTLSEGNHKYKFDAGNLNSGLYLYRISAGSFVQVKKMILIK